MAKAVNKFGARAHTGKKLKVLDQYHGFYPLALRDKFELIYVDAFAGTGEVLLSKSDGNAGLLPGFEQPPEIIEGSAIRALGAPIPYNKYIFVEKSRKKLKTLQEQLEARFPDRITKCEFVCSDANDALKTFCAQTNWKKSRAVVFLDPFGNQIEWETLTALARTRAIDVWYLFPSGLGVFRQIPKRGQVQDEAAESITKILGSDTWRYLFTKETTGENLFGQSETTTQREVSVQAITEHAITRLRSIFEGGVSDEYVALGGGEKVPWYSLIFACSNPEPKAKELAMKVAKWIVQHS
jgi:three-Cys-motif partner protein